MIWKKVLYFIGIVLCCSTGFLIAKTQATVTDSLDVIQKDYDTTLSTVDLKGIKVNSDSDIVNILLVGNDYREEAGYGASGLTDTMLIATLDKKHNALKLTSLMRDQLVDIPGHGQNKLNAANSWGGIKLLYQTIAQNYNIKLDGYVEVSFQAFVRVVNDVGGVELELTQSEADYLNSTNYIRKKEYRNVKAGKQTLNGSQALGYCRIRKEGTTINGLRDDWGRTWRQRTTINAIFDKVKKLPMSEWLHICKDVLKYVKTDLKNKQIIGYVKDVVFMGTTDIKQLQIPYPHTFGAGSVPGVGSCLTIDAAQQSAILKQFIFDYNGKKEFEYNDGTTALPAQ